MSLQRKSPDADYYKRILGWGQTSDRTNEVHPCNCVGPQDGDPVCPCQMRHVSIRNGRYVRVIDLGPAPAADDSSSD